MVCSSILLQKTEEMTEEMLEAMDQNNKLTAMELNLLQDISLAT